MYIYRQIRVKVKQEEEKVDAETYSERDDIWAITGKNEEEKRESNPVARYAKVLRIGLQKLSMKKMDMNHPCVRRFMP